MLSIIPKNGDVISHLNESVNVVHEGLRSVGDKLVDTGNCMRPRTKKSIQYITHGGGLRKSFSLSLEVVKKIT